MSIKSPSRYKAAFESIVIVDLEPPIKEMYVPGSWLSNASLLIKKDSVLPYTALNATLGYWIDKVSSTPSTVAEKTNFLSTTLNCPVTAAASPILTVLFSPSNVTIFPL